MSSGARYWHVSASRSCNVLPTWETGICMGARDSSGLIAIIGIPLKLRPNGCSLISIYMKTMSTAHFVPYAGITTERSSWGYIIGLQRKNPINQALIIFGDIYKHSRNIYAKRQNMNVPLLL